MQKCIHIETAKADMILGKAVTDDQGRTLCAEGTKLTEKLINRFTQMGINALYIKTDEVMSEEDYQKEKQRIEEMFGTPPAESLLKKIKTIALEQLDAKKG